MADDQLGLTIVMVLVAILLSSFFLGRSLNYRKQRTYYRLLADEVRPFSRTLTYRSYGPSAISYAFPSLTGKSAPFNNLQASVTLLDRENLFHYVFSKLRGGNDRTIVKADLKFKPNIKFEMFLKKGAPYRLAKRTPVEGLKAVRNEAMSGDFLLRSTDPGMAQKALSIMLTVTKLGLVRPYLEHFSLSSESPHIVLIYNNKGEYSGLFRFLWDYGKLLNDAFSKMVRRR